MLRSSLSSIASGLAGLRLATDAAACVSACTLRNLLECARPVLASGYHTSTGLLHGGTKDPTTPTIKVTFIDRDGSQQEVRAPIGQSMLEAAHSNDVDLEGACEGSLACSTCHVIVEGNYYDLIPEADDDENDMLDLAFGLTEKSRLGCQIIAKEDLDGIVLKIPSATRNMAVDGHRPKPH